MEVHMAKILCPKGHEKVWFGNPCRECAKEERAVEKAAPATQPALRLAQSIPEVCPDECCTRCWEEGKEVEATSEDGELCHEHVLERADFRLGDL
jgi:hypothetical protein